MFGAAGCVVFGPDEARLSGYGDALQLMLSYVLLREDGGVFKASLMPLCLFANAVQQPSRIAAKGQHPRLAFLASHSLKGRSSCAKHP